MSLSNRFRKFFVTNPGPRKPAVIDPSSSVFNGPFVGPGVPIHPLFGGDGSRLGIDQAPAEPRYFDYVAGVNANVIPRTEYGNWLPNFFQLWFTYEYTPLLKVAVTHRTQSILSLSWTITQRKGSGFRAHSHDNEFRKLLERPDPQNGYNFEGWLRAILEEIYVTDALTIYPVRNRLKRVLGFMQIDGQTIKPLIDYEHGGPPCPPNAAYIQYIKGSPYTTFTSEQILYKPFRPRVWCIYGRSRVENILQTMWLYTLQENWVADYFKQGNLPEVAALVNPEKSQDWDEAKYLAWQQLMDTKSGVNVDRRRVHLFPPFINAVEQLKTFSFDKELPSWLVRILCAEFGMPSYIFASETNKATAKEMNEALYEIPLRHDLQGTKRLFDELAEIAGFPELEFNWTKDLDYRKEAVEGLILLATPPPTGGDAIMSRDEARAYLGLQVGDVETEGGGATPGVDDQDEDEGDQAPAAAAPAKPGDEPPSDDEEEEEPAAAAPQKGTVIAARGRFRLAASKVQKSTAKPHVAGDAGKAFKGPDAMVRAREATKLGAVIYKRLRQHQSSIMKDALARARARGRVVKGVTP